MKGAKCLAKERRVSVLGFVEGVGGSEGMVVGGSGGKEGSEAG